MRGNRLLKWIGVLTLSLMLSALAAPAAQALTVRAFVVRQVCFNADFARATLSATVTPSQPAKYRWSFTNNGTFTPFSSNPTVSHLYPEGLRFTARVQVKNARGQTTTNTVTFVAKSCPM